MKKKHRINMEQILKIRKQRELEAKKRRRLKIMAAMLLMIIYALSGSVMLVAGDDTGTAAEEKAAQLSV